MLENTRAIKLTESDKGAPLTAVTSATLTSRRLNLHLSREKEIKCSTLYFHTLRQDHRVFSNRSGGEEKWGSGEQTFIPATCGTIQRQSEAAGLLGETET